MRRSSFLNRMFVMALIPIVALAVVGLTHTLLQDNLYVVGRVETAVFRQTICLSKIVSSMGYDGTIVSNVIGGGQTLIIECTNVSSGWYIWVGLLVRNDGTVPSVLESPMVWVNGADYDGNTVQTYFYGPYSGDGCGEYEVGDPPLDGLNHFGMVVLNPGEKAIVWIRMECGQEERDYMIIYVTLRYSAP
ncbi:MAG: hypothetical protein QW701_02205 [Candidatus Nezhaarchaeales archaeon]